MAGRRSYESAKNKQILQQKQNEEGKAKRTT
jgi:hypothetical protein